MATDTLCLENIDEFVHDENRIVTCKWLSLTLKIPINQSKRLLYTFLQQQRKQHKDVNATYFVAGLSKGDNGHMEHKCLVVAEEDLDTTRSQLSTVTSCHVYSIHLANLKDSNSLYMTDYEGIRENLADCNKYSSIHCRRAAVPRSQPSRKTASPDKPLDVHRGDRGSSKGEGQQKQSNGSAPHKPGSVEPQSARGKKAEPKGSIATMFAQFAKNRDTATAKKKDTAPKEMAKENKPAVKKGGVMDLFANAKPAAKPKAAVVEKEAPVTKEIRSAESKVKTVQETKSKKSRHKDDSDSDDQPEKKRRRRIKNDLFDSSSEEEMDVEAESPVPSPVREPSPDPESPTPGKKTPEKPPKETPPPQEDRPANGGKQRRRRRKLVPRTYLDEEGFMVTEKVWESESTDASEVEEEARKKAAAPKKKPEQAPAKKASPQKKTSPSKGKQTSLMSFFKKK